MSKKTILIVIFLSFLNGCVQNTAMLGPVFTYSTSGNAFQTGLSYSSNQVIKKYSKNRKDRKSLKNENLELNNSLKTQIAETRKKLKITK
jgi:hypothetical protein|tara:strand:+ start:150 stop:419 length:270 start_codon:yes stop_codon:yes gene_type:complete